MCLGLAAESEPEWRMPVQSLDEIKLLKYINSAGDVHKNHVLEMYDYMYHREHLFIVTELLRDNLYEFSKYNRESGGEPYFTLPRLQRISTQILSALAFIHSLGVIHCDLKPENILIKSYSRCEIKVIDFGSSCYITDHLTSYVQSRSYRAPEVMLGCPYGRRVDIWSLGCIIAELWTGDVLLQNDSIPTLLARIIGIIGPFPRELLEEGRYTDKYFTRNYTLYEKIPDSNNYAFLYPKKTSLQHRMHCSDDHFLSFLHYLLTIDPAERPTSKEALRHPWITKVVYENSPFEVH